MESLYDFFKGAHYPKEIMLMAIRWYVAYPLSYRDVEELLKERGLPIDHATVNRWVIRYSPKLEAKFRHHQKPTGSSWKMDETYIKVKGKWVYYYRAIDKDGNTLDFFLSEVRDTAAATAFFEKAFKSCERPDKVNMDKSGSNFAAITMINQELDEDKRITVRQVKYLNNLMEQDHRFIKKITKPMLGFKDFSSAAATLAGIELCHMLGKRQLVNDNRTTWEQFYVLAA